MTPLVCGVRDVWGVCVCVVVMLCLGFGVVASAWGITPAVLVDDRMDEHRVQLTGIRNEMLIFFDDERTLQRESIGQYMQLRLLNEGGRAVVATVGGDQVGAHHKNHVCVDLVDGQRLCARWSGVGEDGQSLRLVHDQLGEFDIRLDQLRGLRFERGIELAQGSGDLEDLRETDTNADMLAVDRVVLRNGDSLNGFVDAVGDNELMLLPLDDEDGVMVLPCDRVASVRLANGLVRSDGSYHLVGLRDGSWVRVAGLGLDDDQWQMRPVLGLSMQPTVLDLDYVVQIEIAVAGGQWVGLDKLTMQVAEGGDVLGWPTPPMWRGGDLVMHAPLRLRFELPAGAKRMIGTALFDAIDEPTGAWGDVEMHVRVGHKSEELMELRDVNEISNTAWIGSYPINAQHSQARVDVPLVPHADGFYLFIEVDSAGNGPIMDRVRLVEPRVFVESR